MKQIIYLWLPDFATDRIASKISGKSRVNSSRYTPNKPLVTVMSIAGSQRIVSANMAARKVGITPNQSLADARAIYPKISTALNDHSGDLKSLKNLGIMCEKYTPQVSVDSFTENCTVSACKDFGLFLNVTGSVHLFDNEETLLQNLLFFVKRLGYLAFAGLATTPGAAWALTRYKTNLQQDNLYFILKNADNIQKTLANLPIAGLRLNSKTVQELEYIGLRCIGDLYTIPRSPIINRFGKTVLQQLDQALGVLDEPLSPIKKPTNFLSRIVFTEPIALRDCMQNALTQLLISLCSNLEKANRGARQLILTIYRLDNSIQHIQVGTARPERDPKHLQNIFQENLDKIDLGFGVEVITLGASKTNHLKARQIEIRYSPSTQKVESFTKFLDKLAIRTGHNNIRILKLCASHIPELASQESPILSTSNKNKKSSREPSYYPIRPLQLLVHPLPIEVLATVPDGPPIQFLWRRQVHQIVAVEGPERITPEWWHGSRYNIKKLENLTEGIRDYYRIEVENGQRYWLYRAGLYHSDKLPKWYIHGFFP